MVEQMVVDRPGKRSRSSKDATVVHEFKYQSTDVQNDELPRPCNLKLYSNNTVSFNDCEPHGAWLMEYPYFLVVQFHWNADVERIKTMRFLSVAGVNVWLSTSAPPWQILLVRVAR